MAIFMKILVTLISMVGSLPLLYVYCDNLTRESSKGDEDYCINKTKMDIANIFVMVMMSIVIPIVITFITFDNRPEKWYYYLIPISYAIFWQFVWACLCLVKKLLPIVLPILAIAFGFCLILPIRDFVLPYQQESDNQKEIVVEYENPLSKEEIRARLNAHSIKLTSYSEGKYIYEINKGLSSGYGCALVDSKQIKFIPCEYKNEISEIRNTYPSKDIASLGIILKDDRPYGKFAILKREKIFERPKVDFEILLDLQTGEELKNQ